LYRISYRVLSTAPSQLKVGHSGLNFGITSIPSTGGVWQTITDTITLPALSYTGIHVVAGSPKFNWFSIDDCVASSSARHSVVTQAQPVQATMPAIFPNPATDKIVITPGNGGFRQIQVYDVNGRMVDVWRIAPGKGTMTKDIGRYSPGVYLLMFQGGKERQTLRMIKQ
jgi:hypothetical protein